MQSKVLTNIIRESDDLGLQPREKEDLLTLPEEPWTLVLNYLLLNQRQVGDNIKDAVGACLAEASRITSDLSRASTATKNIFHHIYQEHTKIQASLERLENLTTYVNELGVG